MDHHDVQTISKALPRRIFGLPYCNLCWGVHLGCHQGSQRHALRLRILARVCLAAYALAHPHFVLGPVAPHLLFREAQPPALPVPLARYHLHLLVHAAPSHHHHRALHGAVEPASHRREHRHCNPGPGLLSPPSPQQARRPLRELFIGALVPRSYCRDQQTAARPAVFGSRRRQFSYQRRAPGAQSDGHRDAKQAPDCHGATVQVCRLYVPGRHHLHGPSCQQWCKGRAFHR
mmetsp:Transcript_1987/g.4555  ORF Transcript_1987/g.4555 Transcript_1987/m.4555 type:complete len:232 (+) Transcript_1987:824-1519(+)